MKFGIIVFPGSNCDRDMMHALRDDLQQEIIMLLGSVGRRLLDDLLALRAEAGTDAPDL